MPRPCSEKFNNFKKTELGGFCNSCSKEVIDFTNKNDLEILNYFKNNNENTCGKFHEKQLKTYHIARNTQELTKHSYLSTIGFSILALFSSNFITAQKNNPNTIMTQPLKKTKKELAIENTTIKGTICSNTDGLPLPGASIVLKNSILGTETDFDGNFAIKNIKEGDVLSFYYLGYKSQEICIQKNQSSIHIKMEEDTTLLADVVTVGEINIKATHKTKRTLLQRIKSIF